MAEPWQLALTSVLQSLGAVLFVYVGYRLSQRQVAPEARFALRGFVWWWYGLAAVNVLGVAFNLYVAASEPALWAFLANTVIVIAAICVISFGLLVYLLYLYTGRRRVRTYLGAFYVAFFIVVMAWVFVQDPFVAEDEAGTPHLDYADELPEWTATALGVLLVGPLLGGAIAYAFLYFRVETPTQKYRIIGVSSALILWFGSSFLNTLLSAGGSDGSPQWWPVISQLIGLLAALLVLFAYYPPRWLQRRFRVAAVLSED